MRISNIEIDESVCGKRGNKITVAEVSRVLGKDPSFIRRIMKKKQGCPALLAGEIDEAARAIGNFKGLPPESLTGWRLIDLRPDILKMVLRAIFDDANTFPDNPDEPAIIDPKRSTIAHLEKYQEHRFSGESR